MFRAEVLKDLLATTVLCATGYLLFVIAGCLS